MERSTSATCASGTRLVTCHDMRALYAAYNRAAMNRTMALVLAGFLVCAAGMFVLAFVVPMFVNLFFGFGVNIPRITRGWTTLVILGAFLMAALLLTLFFRRASRAR